MLKSLCLIYILFVSIISFIKKKEIIKIKNIQNKTNYVYLLYICNIYIYIPNLILTLKKFFFLFTKKIYFKVSKKKIKNNNNNNNNNK